MNSAKNILAQFEKLNEEEWNKYFETLKSEYVVEQRKAYPNDPHRNWEGEYKLSIQGGGLRGGDFSHRKISKIHFDSIVFDNCLFKECIFENGQFGNCTFINCDFTKSIFNSFTLSIAKSEGKNKFIEAAFNGSFHGDFSGSDFRSSRSNRISCQSVKLSGADLRGASFAESNLSHSKWDGAKIDRYTNFDNAVFDEKHPITRDGSEYLKFSWFGRNWPFNWGAIRMIGNSPIFRVSWGLFIFSLFAINTIGFLNETKPVVFEGLNYIPVPHKLYLIVISSLFLIIGGLLFSWHCPEKVRAFTKSEWVFEHRHPRVEYLIECLQKPYWLTATIFSLLVGGSIALWLIGGSVMRALFYVLLGSH